MTAMPSLDWAKDPVEKLRAGYAADRAAMVHEAAGDVAIAEFDAPTGTGLVFTPANATGPDMLYFHGGGWIVGSPATHKTLCSWLAHFSGSRVFAAPYDLAPEKSWPHQPDQAAEILDWFAASREAVYIAGDSAGGAMALWAEHSARANTKSRIRKIAALYPSFGVQHSASITKFGAGSDGLTEAAMRVMFGHLGCETAEEFQSRLPKTGAPLLLVRAESDPLADDVTWGQGHFDRDLTVISAPNAPHAFLQFAGSSGSARDVMQQIGQWFQA